MDVEYVLRRTNHKDLCETACDLQVVSDRLSMTVIDTVLNRTNSRWSNI